MSRRTSLARVVAIAASMFLLVAVARPVAATLIVIPNASFQNPDLADNIFTDTLSNANAVPNWTFTNSSNGTLSAGVWDPGSVDYTVAGGDNTPLPGSPLTAEGGQNAYVYLGQDDNLNLKQLSGTLATADPVALIEDDTVYTLTVALGRAKNVPTGDVTIALSVLGVPLTSFLIPAGTIPQDTFTNYSIALKTFPDHPFNGFELRAQITHEWSLPNDASVDIDNVRLDIARVPEPGSALALIALGTLLPIRRRRRR